MIISVNSVEYVDAYRLRLAFSTGETVELDLQEHIFASPHLEAKPLRSLDEFRRFFLDPWPTVAWESGYDIAPERLYEMAMASSPARSQQI
jgi:hypothetical protein